MSGVPEGVAALERALREGRKRATLLIGIGGTLFLLGLALAVTGYFASVPGRGGMLFYGLLALLVGAGVGYAGQVRRERTGEMLKREALVAMIASRADGIGYAPKGQLSLDDFVSSKLFTDQPDRWDGEDRIEGAWKGVRFRASEFHAEEKRTHRDKNGHRRTNWVTIFRGVLLVADHPLELPGAVTALPDAFGARSGGVLQQLQGVGSRLRGRGELVQLEDPEFERDFVVYADDQLLARRVLTPTVMVRWRELARRHRDLRLAYRDGTLYAAWPLHGRRWFEPDLGGSTVAATLLRPRRDLEELLDFLEALGAASGATRND